MRIISVLVLLFITWAGIANAQQKIGFIDAQRILKNAPQVTAARADLERQFKPRREELQKLATQIEAVQQDVVNDQALVNDEQSRQQKTELLDLQRSYDRLEQEITEDMNLQRNLILRDLQKLVSDEVLRIAEEEEFDLIVQEVVFASKRIDITDRVLEILEERAEQ